MGKTFNIILVSLFAAASITACSSKKQKSDEVTMAPEAPVAEQPTTTYAAVPNDLGASSAGLSH